jgi:hypothetical protein
MQAKWVRLEHAYSGSKYMPIIAVMGVPAIGLGIAPIGDIGIPASLIRSIAPKPVPGRPGPRSVFPLGFSQQPVTLAGHLGKPSHISVSVVPRHVDHRPLTSAPALIGRQRTTCGEGELIVLLEGHLVFADGERFPDHDSVSGLFAGSASESSSPLPIKNSPAGTFTIIGSRTW